MFFNNALLTSIAAMVLAQLIKFPLNYLLHKEVNPSIIFSTGGMPSSHSAFVTSLAIAVGIERGIETTDFAIAFVLAGVVIHDAMGIRREAGRHATELNKIGEDLEQLFDTLPNKRETSKSIDNIKLKELLGHEPSEALAGIIFGILVASISYLFF